MASHEFRTPLAIIDGTLQRLRRRAASLGEDDLRRYCEKIAGSVGRMIALIESTLSVARLEAGTLEVRPRACDVAQVLRGCCERQDEISPSHRIALTIEGAPDRIWADPSALDQVFTNLLSNAVKYSPEADRVEVRLRRDDGQLIVSVRDFGLGIDEEDVRRIGERFFRAKSSAGVAGTGIGLDLARELMKRHGGDLTVVSKLGEGSTFTARLPITLAAGD